MANIEPEAISHGTSEKPTDFALARSEEGGGSDPSGRYGRFVGRSFEFGVLQNYLDSACRGTGGIVLLGGEAGIGKTRLAEEIAARARADVCWGRCWEGEGAPAFWPWIQIIRKLTLSRDPEQLREIMGPGAADIAQLVPELRTRLLDVCPLPEPLEPEQARFRLFDSISRFLRHLSEAKPTLLILDDAHWGDTPSLKLLRFLAHDIRGMPLLIIATYRSVNGSYENCSPELKNLILRCRGDAHLVLRGLNRSEVQEYIASAGAPLTAASVEEVHAATDGNPLFIGEVVRVMLGGVGNGTSVAPGSSGVSDGLRVTLLRRVRSLSPEAIGLIHAASVAGREFTRQVVERAIPGGRVSPEAWTEVCLWRILEKVPLDDTRCRFTHAIIREAIYEGLSTEVQKEIHFAVARATEDVFRGESDDELSAIALHFYRALPTGDVDKAILYGMRAAERATRLLAHEDAVAHYRRSLDADRIKGGDRSRRCEILINLGQALARAGDLVGAKETFAQAADAARQLGSANELARAALGICGLFPATKSADEALQRLLEEVLERSDGSVNALHASVLAAAATALQFSWSSERRLAVARRALLIAQKSCDVKAELHALDAMYYALLEPTNIDERLAVAQELVKLADRSGDREMQLRGHCHLLILYLELSNLPAADFALEAMNSLAVELRQPSYQWQVTLLRAMRLLLTGAFEEGQRLSALARDMGRKFSDSRAMAAFVGQDVWFRRERGLLDGVEEVIGQSGIVGVVDAHLLGSITALVLAETERIDEARKLLAMWKTRLLPENAFTLTIVSILAMATSAVNDSDFSVVLYEKLLPFRGRGITPPLGGAVFLGAVDLYLGMLAAVARNWVSAARHFVEALEIHIQMGARPLTARTRFEYCKTLFELGEGEEAGRQLSNALAEFESLGMDGCARSAVAFGASLGIGAGKDGLGNCSLPQRPEARGTFRSDGEYWTVTFAGKTVRLKAVRGFEYISYLLARVNEPVYALDLAVLGMRSADGSISGAAARQEALQGANCGGQQGLVVDERARAEYRARLRELSCERDEAVRLNDYGRLDRIESEIDAIQTHLAAGSRLGGRSRRWGSPAERARVNVRNSIATALRSIAKQHEPLYRHLQNSIKTGAVCSYVPEQPVVWQISSRS